MQTLTKGKLEWVYIKSSKADFRARKVTRYRVINGQFQEDRDP